MKKPVDADYSVFTEEIKLSHKTPKFKVVERVRIIKYKIILSKGYAYNCSAHNPWANKMKDLSRKTK